MPFAPTFGSVGDFIAVCQLCVALARVLDSEKGSIKEYQDFRKDIDAYGVILMQVSAHAEISQVIQNGVLMVPQTP
jgi:hypothetical protein